MNRGIYLAAPYPQRVTMREVRDRLQAMGWIVTSRWIDRTVPDSYVDTLNTDPAATTWCALADLEDVAAAGIVVSFTGGDGGRGGRHVEFGYAWGQEKRLILCGPREHVFHTLPGVEQYPDWPTVVDVLTTDAAAGYRDAAAENDGPA